MPIDSHHTCRTQRQISTLFDTRREAGGGRVRMGVGVGVGRGSLCLADTCTVITGAVPAFRKTVAGPPSCKCNSKCCVMHRLRSLTRCVFLPTPFTSARTHDTNPQPPQRRSHTDMTKQGYNNIQDLCACCPPNRRETSEYVCIGDRNPTPLYRTSYTPRRDTKLLFLAPAESC